jgi:DNA integrity scanning protein DisA with diadenylate cyclase activity
MAAPRKFSDQLQVFCQLADRLATQSEADALLYLVEKPTDWEKLRECSGNHIVLLAGDMATTLAAAAADDGFETIVLNMPPESPVYERLTQALLEAVDDELLPPEAQVVAVYSGFESGVMDSLSIIWLGEHLEQLTIRDLRQLETKIPIDTLQLVVDLAVDIGREGREGKPVGTMFVVGDHRKTVTYCNPMGFDPVRGYQRAERHLKDARVREGVKEVAQLDGAFVVSSDGTVVAACQHLSAPRSTDVSLPKGLGARHWAAAEITRATAALAVTVSESSGTVRVFQNGDVVLRIEPFRRPMKWKDFEYELPPTSGE